MTRALIAHGVIVQILLMILLRRPPFARRRNLRNNLALPPLVIRLLRHLPRHLFLLVVVVVDG